MSVDVASIPEARNSGLRNVTKVTVAFALDDILRIQDRRGGHHPGWARN